MQGRVRGFVARPFGHKTNSDEFWRTMQEVAARFEDFDVDCFNHKEARGIGLFEAIREHVARSDFVIVDFTADDSGPVNGNVLTEAGIAVGVGKPVFIVARGKNYDAISETLPSNWKGWLVHEFPTGNSGDVWESGLENLFEKVLNGLGCSPARVGDKPRQTDHEQYHWLLEFVVKLQKRCKDLYQSTLNEPRWMCGQVNNQRKFLRRTFALHCEQVPDIKVRTGVFLDLWERRGTPFWIVVEDGPNERQRVPVELLDKSPYDLTTHEALDRYIEVLDGVLLGLTEGVSVAADLPKQVDRWDSYVAELNRTCEGMSDDLELQRAGHWNLYEYTCSYLVTRTQYTLSVGMNVLTWAKRGKTPCWIEVRSMHSDPHVLRALDLNKGGADVALELDCWLVPVRLDDKPEKFAEGLSRLLKRVIDRCRRCWRDFEGAADA